MRKSWLIAAAVVGGAAVSTQAADVQVFGIHTPTLGKWAVYAKVANPAGTVGISSYALNVLNNTDVSVTGAAAQAPTGNTNQTSPNPPFNGGAVPYGFWLFRDNGTVVPGTGVNDIRAAQFTEFAPNPPDFSQYVLKNVGVTRGTQAVGGNFTSSATWGATNVTPAYSGAVLLASGDYTRTNATNNGVRINIPDSQTVNLLKDTGGGTWTGPGNVVAPTAVNIVDAVTFATLPQNQQFSVKAGEGDVNLDGQVTFVDLLAVAANFGLAGATWFDGDLNYDQQVGFQDLLTVAARFGQPIPGSTGDANMDGLIAAAFAAVPEPAGLSFLGLAALGLGGRRKRTR